MKKNQLTWKLYLGVAHVCNFSLLSNVFLSTTNMLVMHNQLNKTDNNVTGHSIHIYHLDVPAVLVQLMYGPDANEENPRRR